MASIKGIDIELTVGSIADAGTKDPLYIGIYGKNGGREYAFNFPPQTTGNTGSIRFRFGDGCCKRDNDIIISKECCNLKLDSLQLKNVEYVYIRKHSRQTEGPNTSGNLTTDDDLLLLKTAVVTLCDDTGDMRRFKKTTDMYYAYECGLTHWLPETSKPGCLVTVTYSSVSYTGHDIGNDISYKFTSILMGETKTIDIGEHRFNNNSNEYLGQSISYFKTGCCNNSGEIRLIADVIEHDIIIDDKGHEDIVRKIECKENEIISQNFDIRVYVNENNNDNKKAWFIIRGSIRTECLG